MIKKIGVKILLILSVVFLFTVAVEPLSGISLVTPAVASGGSEHSESSTHEGGGHEKADSVNHNGGHGAEKGGGHHAAESWWRFFGWQGVFAAIACFYFAMVLMWLPKLVAKELNGGHH